MNLRQAPELQTTHWFNTPAPITLKSLRGRVVLIEAFQMLCPGCVSHGLPQAQRVAATFNANDVAVIGLHTVFEHHAGQGTKESLGAFLHEYRLTFPVGIDAPSQGGGIPMTMAAYQMQGTPSLLLIDRLGRVRKHKFGREEDLVLGAEIMSLIREGNVFAESQIDPDPANTPDGCDENGCSA
ncbi:MAG: redoxin family protein [Parvularculaceae bacterium]|nr:redoxin family protein [Parvularculaceae bacterium]